MKGKTTISFPNNTATIEAQCGVTGQLHRITVPLNKWMDWRQGELIQKAFPDLLPHEREMIQTGITPAEWNQMFNA
jgi:hypothetical protein